MSKKENMLILHEIFCDMIHVIFDDVIQYLFFMTQKSSGTWTDLVTSHLLFIMKQQSESQIKDLYTSVGVMKD